MANKVTILIDIATKKAKSEVDSFRSAVRDAEGGVDKFKAGAASAMESVKANAGKLALVGGAAFVAFAAKAIGSASDLSESMNAVDVTFGRSAESIHALGAESVKSFGLSQRAFNEAAVQFSAFAKTIAGPGGDVSATMSDLMGRAVDFASVMNIDVSEAMSLFQSSLAGETEPIRKYGKDLSAATVEQYALSRGLVKTKGDLTDAIKVQARYGLLMESTNDTAGDFANTSGGLANQQRILSANVEDLSARMGAQLLPAMEGVTGAAIELLNAVDKLGSLGDTHLPFLNSDEKAAEFDTWKESVLAGGDAAGELTTIVYDTARSMIEAEIRTAILTKAQDDNTAATEAEADAMVEAKKHADRLADTLDNVRKRTQDATNAQLAAIDSNLGYRNAAANAADAIVALDEKTKSGTLSTEELAQAQRDAEGDILSAAAAAVKLAEDQASANGVTLDAKDKAAIYRDKLVDLSGYISGDLRATIDDYIAQLGRIPTNVQTQVYANVTTNGKGIVTNTGSVKMRASGGPVTAGQPYIVGESEPELFVPNQSGRIMNGDQVGAARSGGGSTGPVAFQLVLGDKTTVNAWMDQREAAQVAQLMAGAR